jgi:hypothetical protein
VGGRSSVILQQGTSFLEVISGFPIAKYALTYALLTAGLILFAWKSTRSTASLVQQCARFHRDRGSCYAFFHPALPDETGANRQGTIAGNSGKKDIRILNVYPQRQSQRRQKAGQLVHLSASAPARY